MSASDIAAWVAVGLAFISAWVAWLQLRGQLRDIARQTQSLKRQQANDVDLDFDPPFDGSPLPQDRPWYAAVTKQVEPAHPRFFLRYTRRARGKLYSGGSLDDNQRVANREERPLFLSSPGL